MNEPQTATLLSHRRHFEVGEERRTTSVAMGAVGVGPFDEHGIEVRLAVESSVKVGGEGGGEWMRGEVELGSFQMAGCVEKSFKVVAVVVTAAAAVVVVGVVVGVVEEGVVVVAGDWGGKEGR